MAAPENAFASTVRSHDWPRHIAIQFAPEAKRPALQALFAFNAEIDRITAIASDPLPGEIRMQWWREVLSGEREGEARGHPLAEALLATIRDFRLPPAAFDHFVEAKTFALYHDAFPDTVSFEAWCGETESALLQLAALVLDPGAAAKSSNASGHGGVALSISTILSNFPRTRSRGQCWIPSDILAACGLTRETFVSGDNPALIASAVSAFAELGLKHFSQFSAAANELEKPQKPAFLPVFPARLAMVRAAAKPSDVLVNGAHVSNLRKFLSMARAALS